MGRMRWHGGHSEGRDVGDHDLKMTVLLQPKRRSEHLETRWTQKRTPALSNLTCHRSGKVSFASQNGCSGERYIGLFGGKKNRMRWEDPSKDYSRHLQTRATMAWSQRSICLWERSRTGKVSLNSNLSFQVSSISPRPLCLPAGHCDFASFGLCVNVQSVLSCLLLVSNLATAWDIWGLSWSCNYSESCTPWSFS